MLNNVKSHSFIAVIVLSVALRIAFAMYTPNWQAPDEYPHFFVLKHIALTQHLVKSTPVFPSYEGYQPPLYYFLAAQLYKVVIHWDALPPDPSLPIDPDADKHPPNAALILLRLFSVALGTATLLMIYKLASQLFSGRPELSLFTLSFAGFLPTFIVNSSSVTNDALANLLGTCLVWLLLQPDRTARTVWLGIVLGLGILTKASLWVFVPLAFVVLLIQDRSFASGLKKFIIVFAVSMAISGWFFVQDYNRYGNIFAFNPGMQTTFPLAGHTLADLWRVIRNMNWSFWAAAGRTYEIHLMPGFYLLVFLPVTLIAIAGMTKILLRKTSGAENGNKQFFQMPKVPALVLTAVVGAEAAAALYYSLMYPINCSWGKYLYPALSAFAVLFVAGTFRLLGDRVAKGVLQVFSLILLGVSGYLLWAVAAG